MNRRSFLRGLLSSAAILPVAGFVSNAISMRSIVSYEPLSQSICELDILYGTMNVKPEWQELCLK